MVYNSPALQNLEDLLAIAATDAVGFEHEHGLYSDTLPTVDDTRFCKLASVTM